MRFELTAEQQDFAATLDKLLAAADAVAVARAWADGDTAPGQALWQRLADQGVTALLLPEDAGGLDASPVELVIAMEAIGRHGVPGPWVETSFMTRLVEGTPDLDARDEVRAAVAAGEELVSIAFPPLVPFALDADVSRTMLVEEGTLRAPDVGSQVSSIDPTRRLFSLGSGRALLDVPAEHVAAAFDLAVLAVSAQLLGAGERLLADSVTYVKQRKQFGREIGSYQAIKHQLADVRIALDFARPLIHGAALTISGPDGSRDVSAAKVAVSDAAYLASRVALQVHGAIGYTQEFDLSLWITKVRALVGAWGTPAYHRGRVLDALVSASSSNGG